MKILLRLIGLLLLLLAFDAASYANAFIIPEELPSILSLVYSNIPPIKKGTDSRLGFGFRLGEHADFQVQLEIGPQQRTRPIGSGSGNSKRNVDSDDYRQYEQQSIGSAANSNSGKSWLETWSKEARQKQNFNKDKHRDATSSATGVPSSPMIDHAAYNQLQQLYDMNKPKEDTIGTIPASELDARLQELHALRSQVPFKPLPTGNETNEVVERKDASDVPFKPLPAGAMSETLSTKRSTSKPAIRRNVRRRTDPNGNNRREKDTISADLADVSLD